jgi:hypothetical protein
VSASRLVRRSPDLARLVEDGFSIRIVNGYLVVDDVPFVDDAAQVQRGSLLCPLDVTGDVTCKPASHVMCFVGGVPRAKDGSPIPDLVNPGVEKWSAGEGLAAACGFSQKPSSDGYRDFYEKVTYYTAMVVGPAQAVDPEATPYTYKPVETDEDDGVFVYMDTFSSRAGITELNQRLALNKIVIIGLGGTGGHLLDLLAKTPAIEIHLYDGDFFRTHNAYRAPGAASLEDLKAGMKKVNYYEQVYSVMRRGIQAHQVNVTEENVDEILDADFVFLAMDTGPDKKAIIEALTTRGVPFIDTGIGVSKDTNGISGSIRITTSVPGRTDHIERDGLISYFVGDDAEYDTNLQVVELNSIAANLAVMRYKKHLGFYADTEHELHTVYEIGTNELFNRYSDSAAQDETVDEPGAATGSVTDSGDAGNAEDAA